jgi:hypothetical protein
MLCKIRLKLSYNYSSDYVLVVEDASRPRQRAADYDPLIVRRLRASQQADKSMLTSASKLASLRTTYPQRDVLQFAFHTHKLNESTIT